MREIKEILLFVITLLWFITLGAWVRIFSNKSHPSSTGNGAGGIGSGFADLFAGVVCVLHVLTLIAVGITYLIAHFCF